MKKITHIIQFITRMFVISNIYYLQYMITKKTNKKLLYILISVLSYNINVFSQVIDSYQYDNVVNTGWKTTYKNGVSKTYYIENGISVTTSANLLNQYGKYFQVHIEIENLTGSEFTFNPNATIALLTKYKTDKKTKIVSVSDQIKGVVLSAEEYIKKVQKRQNFQSAMFGYAAQYNASNAGYSSSVTSTAVYGQSNTYGTINNYYTGEKLNVKGTKSTTAVGTSVTKSYNGQAAYNAMKQAQNESQKFDNELYQIRTELSQNYLKINTIEHRQRLKGSINIQFESVDKVEILIPVNGKYYSFVYSNDKEINKQEILQEKTISDVSDNTKVNELFSQSQSDFNNKNFSNAIEQLTAALKIEPDNITLLSYRGSLYFFNLNNKEKGISDLELAISSDKSNKFKFRNYTILCHMYSSIHNYEKMKKNAEDLINLEPNKPEGYFNRAMANSGLKNIYATINDYQKIIKLSNNQLKTYDNLGLVYNNLGYSYVLLEDYDKALPLINKAIELLPNYSFVWGSRGELYYKIGEYKKCITDMTTAIELVESNNSKGVSSDPSNPYYFRALSNIKRGKIQESCYDLSKAVELGNKNAEIEFNNYCIKQ